MRKFGLIGNPLEHSFSKKYFTEKFEKEKMPDCSYELFPIPSLDDLIPILKENPELEGLNVTIPYKQQVLRRLNSIARIPVGLESCNCIKIIDGKFFGYNTDIIGFEKSISPLLKPHHQGALVLGNGGASAAVIHVLKKLGISYDIVSRTLDKGATLTFQDLNDELVKKNLLIINTTPVGMFPKDKEAVPIPFDSLGSQHLCYDLIYNPEKTIFLQMAETQGAVIKNGLEMVQIQADESWKIWNS